MKIHLLKMAKSTKKGNCIRYLFWTVNGTFVPLSEHEKTTSADLPRCYGQEIFCCCFFYASEFSFSHGYSDLVSLDTLPQLIYMTYIFKEQMYTFF